MFCERERDEYTGWTEIAGQSDFDKF
jgi:hypothetical protein